MRPDVDRMRHAFVSLPEAGRQAQPNALAIAATVRPFATGVQ